MSKILCVDDVELFLELERSFLGDAGYEVVTARSGEAALELVAAGAPDLILLDLFMAGIDGDEVCRRLRADQRWCTLPVVMVTAAGKAEQIQRCLAAGCDDYVTKPINKQGLLEKIQRLLGKVRSRTTPRVPVALRVQLQSRGRSLEACALDISRNGIFVKSRSLLEPGAPVQLQISLPDGQELPLLGKVKRVQQGADEGMGIYFVHPDPEECGALEKLVQGRASSAPAPAPGSSLSSAKGAAVAQDAEIERLMARISELEQENREFAERMIEVEQVNNNLTNLYIASTRLHSELNRPQVLSIIKEVVINFVGAEKFALLMLDGSDGCLRFAAGEGFDEPPFPELDGRERPWCEVIEGGESRFEQEIMATGSDDPHQPLAVIPLRIHERTTGVLAIYRLFVQKERFEPVDYQLFSMMAEHAATALFSSSLYEASERKRQTYQGVMDLLLK